MWYLERYGEKYREMKHILNRAHDFYLTRIQKVFLLPPERSKGMRKIRMKRSLYLYLLKQEVFKNKTLKKQNHTCIYTVIKISSKKKFSEKPRY